MEQLWQGRPSSSSPSASLVRRTSAPDTRPRRVAPRSPLDIAYPVICRTAQSSPDKLVACPPRRPRQHPGGGHCSIWHSPFRADRAQVLDGDHGPRRVQMDQRLSRPVRQLLHCPPHSRGTRPSCVLLPHPPHPKGAHLYPARVPSLPLMLTSLLPSLPLSAHLFSSLAPTWCSSHPQTAIHPAQPSPRPPPSHEPIVWHTTVPRRSPCIRSRCRPSRSQTPSSASSTTPSARASAVS